MTCCLTHAAHKMADKNVLVKNLEAVETVFGEGDVVL